MGLTTLTPPRRAAPARTEIRTKPFPDLRNVGESVGETRSPVSRACDTAVMELAADLTVDDTMLVAFCREHGIRSLRLYDAG